MEGYNLSSTEIYVRIFILLGFIILSAFFSGSETALTSITASQITKIREEDEKTADLLRNMKVNIGDILSAILIGNNLVNIGASTLLTALVIRVFGEGRPMLISTMVLTVVILIFGEITPKTYSSQNSVRIVKLVYKPLRALTFIMKPILFFLKQITGVIFKILGGNISSQNTFVTEEEIRSLVDAGEDEGLFMQEEKEMIQNIFEIDDLEVDEVMVPRVDVVAIEINASIDEMIKLSINHGYSRLPVYDESIDNIVGIIYAKDMLPLLLKEKSDIKLKDLMREPYYVPESKKINELLKELRNQQVHMAIVLDEYGATEGVVTIEDILEEIVGDIFDEFDNEEDSIEELGYNVFRVKGDMSLEDLNEEISIELPEEEFDSIGGYVFNTLGRLPIIGDTLESEDCLIKVTGVKKRRVTEVEIKKIEEDINE